MGRRRRERDASIVLSQTLPSSPAHSSSSSSDFEFRISSSPSNNNKSSLCPADDLFYKGQLLPLHLSPRLSMVRTLLLASSSSTSSSSPRDSTGSSSNDSTSSFYSDLVTDEDHHHDHEHFKPRPINNNLINCHNIHEQQKKSNKYFSLSKLSSVFRKESKNKEGTIQGSNYSVKKMSTTAKEVITRYLKKVKPFCDKLSQKQEEEKVEMKKKKKNRRPDLDHSMKKEINMNSGSGNGDVNVRFSHSFSGNIVMYPRRRRCVSSCPSSMRSSPTHVNTVVRESWRFVNGGQFCSSSNDSSMEELQSAIQGAIAHCKNSMIQSNGPVMMSKEV